MRLAMKAATVLALASLVKSEKVRKSLTAQADAGLTFMTLDTMAPSATAVFDYAAEQGIAALRHEGWTSDKIADAVTRELRNARIVPTVRSGAVA